MPVPEGQITGSQIWQSPIEPVEEECTCAETRTNASCEICDPTVTEETDDL